MARVNGVFLAGVNVNSTTAIAPSITTVAGNLLAVFVTWVDASGTSTVTVTDSLGSTYVAGTKFRNSGTTASQMFYALNVTAGSNVVTGTFSVSTTFKTVVVEQHNNVLTTGALDLEVAPTTGTNTTPETGTFSTISALTVVIGMCAGNPAVTPGPGYAQRQTGNYATSIDRYNSAVLSNATAGITNSPAAAWNMHAMVFKLATSEGTPTSFSRNNAALAYSPYTWNDDGTSANAISAGAYVKFNFTGTTFAMTIAALSGLSVYPTFRAYIDNRPAIDVTPSSGQTLISFAAGLSAGTHTCTVMLKGMPLEGRWDRTAALKIINVLVDNGSTISAPTLRPKRYLAFGDSLTEGERTLSTAPPPAGADAILTVVPIFAETLQAEYGQVGHGGQGFTQAGVGSGANIVPAFNTAWSFYSSGVSRLTGGLFSPAPDYITCMHGTNGTPAQSDVATAIANMRGAAPNAWIFMIVPIGGFRRTAITAATNAAITAGDTKLALIDAGTGYQAGVEGTPAGTVALGATTETSTDTIHPVQRTNARVAGEYLRQIQHILEPRRFTVVGQ